MPVSMALVAGIAMAQSNQRVVADEKQLNADRITLKTDKFPEKWPLNPKTPRR